MTLQWKSRWPVSALIAGVLLSLSGTGVEAASAVITGEGGWLFLAWESLSKVDNPGTTRNIALVKQLQQNLAREHISLVVLVVPM
ncbi:twin-arginine translocation pathway signal, partial [Pseudomonas sp. GW247-3R2A]